MVDISLEATYGCLKLCKVYVYKWCLASVQFGGGGGGGVVLMYKCECGVHAVYSQSSVHIMTLCAKFYKYFNLGTEKLVCVVLVGNIGVECVEEETF